MKIPTSRNRSFKQDRQRLYDFIQNIVDQRRGTRKEDFLSYLMEIEEDDKPYFSEEQLRDELVTLYIAGQETTASVLTFGLCYHSPAVNIIYIQN